MCVCEREREIGGGGGINRANLITVFWLNGVKSVEFNKLVEEKKRRNAIFCFDHFVLKSIFELGVISQGSNP